MKLMAYLTNIKKKLRYNYKGKKKSYNCYEEIEFTPYTIHPKKKKLRILLISYLSLKKHNSGLTWLAIFEKNL
jgi:hypothetical protein